MAGTQSSTVPLNCIAISYFYNTCTQIMVVICDLPEYVDVVRLTTQLTCWYCGLKVQANVRPCCWRSALLDGYDCSYRFTCMLQLGATAPFSGGKFFIFRGRSGDQDAHYTSSTNNSRIYFSKWKEYYMYHFLVWMFWLGFKWERSGKNIVHQSDVYLAY